MALRSVQVVGSVHRAFLDTNASLGEDLFLKIVELKDTFWRGKSAVCNITHLTVLEWYTPSLFT